MLVYRDAVDRVSKTLDPRKLTEILYRAEVLGESSLAKAVLWRGYELQNEHVVGTYLQKYPTERQTWDEFVDAATVYNQLEAVGVSEATGVPDPEKPQEVAMPYAGVRGET